MTNFTIEELNKLMQLCDIATKAGGLQVAQEALPIAVKIQQIAKEMQDDNGILPEQSE